MNISLSAIEAPISCVGAQRLRTDDTVPGHGSDWNGSSLASDKLGLLWRQTHAEDEPLLRVRTCTGHDLGVPDPPHIMRSREQHLKSRSEIQICS